MPLDILKGTDIAALHQSIVDTAGAAFAGVHFEFYREDRKNLPFGDGTTTPKAYCLLDLPEMEAAEFDPGTEQQNVRARFEAHFVIKSFQPNARLISRVLAGSFAAFLRKQLRWPGVLNGPIRLVGCYKDDFHPELDQFEVWRVEWEQEIWLGDVSEILLAPPTQVFFSFVPLVGIPYVDEYIPVSQPPLLP